MIDKNFYIHKFDNHFTIEELASLIECKILQKNYENKHISSILPIEDAQPGSLTCLHNKKYIKELQNTKAAACIVPQDFAVDAKLINPNLILLKSLNPYLSYAKAIELFYSSAKNYPNKIMPSAYISSSATIGINCYIGHNVVIEDHVVIGDNAIIDSNTIIDYGVAIGNNAKIYSNVSIKYSRIGNNVVILDGAKIGQDGFGFATDYNSGIHKKIFHVGLVIIGDNVEIGANSTIDRGSIKNTIIEDYCRLDNLVQVGHNAIIGRGTILVAQVGIAGSSKIGQYCALGGQAGVAGHVEIGDKVQVASQSGVIQNVEGGKVVGGTPSVPIRDWHKQAIIMKKLIKQKLV